jgi:hypothetical protein
MTGSISNLAELVAPLSGEPFLESQRRAAQGLLHGASANWSPDFFDWDRFLVLATGPLPPDKLRVQYDRNRIDPGLYRNGAEVDRSKLDRLLARGASMIATEIHPFVPVFAAIAADFHRRTGSHLRTGAIASTGTAGALPCHCDRIDGFILQVDGSKAWRVYPPDPECPQSDAVPVLEVELAPGDYLFVPAGYWHECDTTAERSLHLGFAFARPDYRP